MNVLEVAKVSYDYISKSGVTHALTDITASFCSGKMYALTGRSGSGKPLFFPCLLPLINRKAVKYQLTDNVSRHSTLQITAENTLEWYFSRIT
jgi:ABC-type dipeptide/oligopeptide/nickel transport system ATPase subunit